MGTRSKLTLCLLVHVFIIVLVQGQEGSGGSSMSDSNSASNSAAAAATTVAPFKRKPFPNKRPNNVAVDNIGSNSYPLNNRRRPAPFGAIKTKPGDNSDAINKQNNNAKKPRKPVYTKIRVAQVLRALPNRQRLYRGSRDVSEEDTPAFQANQQMTGGEIESGEEQQQQQLNGGEEQGTAGEGDGESEIESERLSSSVSSSSLSSTSLSVIEPQESAADNPGLLGEPDTEMNDAPVNQNTDGQSPVGGLLKTGLVNKPSNQETDFLPAAAPGGDSSTEAGPPVPGAVVDPANQETAVLPQDGDDSSVETDGGPAIAVPAQQAEPGAAAANQAGGGSSVEAPPFAGGGQQVDPGTAGAAADESEEAGTGAGGAAQQTGGGADESTEEAGAGGALGGVVGASSEEVTAGGGGGGTTYAAPTQAATSLAPIAKGTDTGTADYGEGFSGFSSSVSGPMDYTTEVPTAAPLEEAGHEAPQVGNEGAPEALSDETNRNVGIGVGVAGGASAALALGAAAIYYSKRQAAQSAAAAASA